MFSTGSQLLTLTEILAPLRVLAAGTAVMVRTAGSMAGMAADLMLSWHERAHQRWQLRGLDDSLLKDIGCSRAEAEAEAGKPFWKA